MTHIFEALVNEKDIECDAIPSRIRARKMATEPDWQQRVQGILKGELKRRNIKYRELAARLTAMGIPHTERNISNKIRRGGFSAVFFLQCLEAIGVTDLRMK